MKTRLVAVVVMAALAAVVVRIALPALGLFLVVADPLAPSDAIFVLEGATPGREIEAAALFHRGLAPLVVLALARDPIPESARRLAGELSRQERAVRVLEHVGVPRRAIALLHDVVENTDEELRADFTFARSRHARRVILVTSAHHTRRVRLFWAARSGRTIPALVHPTPYEHFAAERWWQSRRYLEETAHEVFGILNFYLGAPLRTFDRRD